MKIKLKNICYILILATVGNFCISCNNEDMLDEIPSDESIVENILDKVIIYNFTPNIG